ncbi:MAG: AAA family ATPase [Candidatus Omnitrophica bacterium]|nr:AAA family ATPase [Candidatus Omnitrophota bacterium]
MRLSKFRIKNFKSIVDTGYCSFASDLTILIGKNESGKTATLEALRYFNKNIQRVSEDVFPLDGSDKDPSVEIGFRLEHEEINAIQEDTGAKLSEKAVSYILGNGLGVIKNSRGKYGLNEECIDRLFREEAGTTYEDQIKHIKSAKERLQELLKGPQVPAIHFESGGENIQRESKDLIRVVKSYLPSIKDEQMQTEAVEAIRMIIKESKKLTGPQQYEQQGEEHKEQQDQVKNSVAFFLEGVIKHLPNFIFFSEFSDILPFEIAISSLKENQAVLDFAKIASLDLDQFIEMRDVQRRINYLNRHSATISGDFLGYWEQNKIELVVKPEGDKLLFGAKEQGRTDFFKIGQRSKGFQWFLSFYLRLNAEKGKNSVIIIDEPGMHLHAKAQKEIVRVLEDKIVTESQVIFSTHCPYLIDTQRLDRVRLVLKDTQRGTVISEDIHNQTDEESLMPVMTAMGGGKLTTAPLSGKKNVIVGSVADFYFCAALKRYLKDLDLDEINLIPATDIDNIVHLVSLMIGYHLEFHVLLNNNDDGYQKGKHLKERFGLGNERMLSVSRKANYTTEDLFTFEDFNSYVLKGERGEDQAVLNSEYLKDNELNRVLLARRFFDATVKATDQAALSSGTLAAFRRLFEKILSEFNTSPEIEEEPEKIEEKEEKAPEIKTKRRLFNFIKQK